jgi:hypothetical protein
LLAFYGGSTFTLKRSGPHNRFELENLEPRILLSADAVLVSPFDLPDECESDFGIDLLPQIDEVVIGDEDRLKENSYQNQTTYDPSQSIDDIFAGLTEENLIGGDDDSDLEIRDSIDQDKTLAFGRAFSLTDYEIKYPKKTLFLHTQAFFPGGEYRLLIFI